MRCHCLKCVHNIDGFCECSSYIEIDKNGKCDSIKKIPAADVAPVRHGRWRVDGVYVVCSVCNRFTLSPIVKQLPTFKYCPNCGAKMDGD